MQTVSSVDNLFLIPVIGNELFGVPVNYVREIVTMPKINAVANVERHFRGVINLRGAVIPVIDMRLRLGMLSCADEAETYIQMLNDREKDHRNWIQELERSVAEKRSFALATDPHQCAFGKWFYAYDSTSSTNQCFYLDMILPKFEEPHNRIHAIAIKVKELQDSEQFDEAMTVIEKTRETELAKMIELFDEARRLIEERRRELAVVIEIDSKKIAMAVDAVKSIEPLNQTIKESNAVTHLGMKGGLVETISQRTKEDTMVMVLNVKHLS